jgi:hypothetical protein
MIQLPKQERATLPSVENWYTNTNILKLPPQAVFTRRRDKVGENNQINEWVGDSGDRVCEGISKFARGINPMVSVSYTDYNGGMRGNPTSYSNSVQPSLPFKAMDNGAFRPPILTQFDLLPLSRLPRTNFSAITNPDYQRYYKNVHTAPTKDANLRSVKKTVLQGNIRPSAYIAIEKPLVETGHEKCSIKDSLIIPVNSGVRSMDLKQPTPQAPGKEITDDTLYTSVTANISDSNKFKRNVFEKIGVDKFIQDIVNTPVTTNVSMPVRNSAIHSIPDKGVHDEIALISYNSGVRGSDKYTYYDTELNLERRLPEYSIQANLSDQKRMINLRHTKDIELSNKQPTTAAFTNAGTSDKAPTDTISERDYKRLPDSLQKGGFENVGFIPTFKTSENKTNETIAKNVPTKNLKSFFQRY